MIPVSHSGVRISRKFKSWSSIAQLRPPNKKQKDDLMWHMVVPSICLIIILIALFWLNTNSLNKKTAPATETISTIRREASAEQQEQNIWKQRPVQTDTAIPHISNLRWTVDGVSDKTIALWPQLRASDTEQGPMPQSIVMSTALCESLDQSTQQGQRKLVVLVLTIGVTKQIPLEGQPPDKGFVPVPKYVSAPLEEIQVSWDSKLIVCVLVPPPEHDIMPYSGARDLKLFSCSIPAGQEIEEMEVEISAPNHSYVVKETARLWDSSSNFGHRKPERVYSYTLVTLMKPRYSVCTNWLNPWEPSPNGTEPVICNMPSSERAAEWIAHHLLLGFEHIYIYVTDGWSDMHSKLLPFIEKNQLSILAAPRVDDSRITLEGAQVSIFTMHLQKYSAYSNFLYIADLDELLYVNPVISSETMHLQRKQSTNTHISHLVSLMEHEHAQNNTKLCSLYFAWWIVLPNRLQNMTNNSMIRSFRKSYFKGYPDRDTIGEGKTMTKMEFASQYANQHFVNFRDGTQCERTIPKRDDAVLIHYRIAPRVFKGSAKRVPFNKMDTFYPAIAALLKSLHIWQ